MHSISLVKSTCFYCDLLHLWEIIQAGEDVLKKQIQMAYVSRRQDRQAMSSGRRTKYYL